MLRSLVGSEMGIRDSSARVFICFVGHEYERTSLRSDLASLGPRFARRRYLTFVATALSNVCRTNGRIDGFSDFPIFGFSDFWIFRFLDFCFSGFGGFWIWGVWDFFDFGSYRARMQRRGHGCSAEGTRDGRTTSQRIRTFVATALSNVRRDGVI